MNPPLPHQSGVDLAPLSPMPPHLSVLDRGRQTSFRSVYPKRPPKLALGGIRVRAKAHPTDPFSRAARYSVLSSPDETFACGLESSPADRATWWTHIPCSQGLGWSWTSPTCGRAPCCLLARPAAWAGSKWAGASGCPAQPSERWFWDFQTSRISSCAVLCLSAGCLAAPRVIFFNRGKNLSPISTENRDFCAAGWNLCNACVSFPFFWYRWYRLALGLVR